MVINKDNINQFIDGTTLNCSHKYITHIEYIPEGLIDLYCEYNQLNSLPKLPESLTRLYCYNNKLNSLPKLPESLIELYCWDNQLTSLPKLPDGLIDLFCENNNLPYEITLDNLKEHNNRIKLSNRSKIINTICNYYPK